MGLSRQEYWSGLPFTTPGDLPDSVIKPGSPTLLENSFFFFCRRILYRLCNQGSPVNTYSPSLMRTYCIAQETLLDTLCKLNAKEVQKGRGKLQELKRGDHRALN